MNDIDQKIRDISQEIRSNNATEDQFAVAQVPYHIHNGADSQKVSYVNLVNRFLQPSTTLPGTSAATVTNYGHFFIAQYPCVVTGIQEVHGTKGTDSAPVYLQVEKLTGTTASGSGTKLLRYAITAATVQAGGSGYAVNDTITLTGGSGTQAILKVLTITGSALATVSVQSQGAYTAFPANPVSQGSSSGAGTGATFNLTSTDGFDLKANINTVQTGILTQVISSVQMAVGDRLGLLPVGTLTAVAQVYVSVQITF